MKDIIQQCLNDALNTLKNDSVLPTDINPNIQVTRCKDDKHGDFATNLALVLANTAQKNPRELAQALCNALPNNEQISKTEIAGPGFINFFIQQAAGKQVINDILQQGPQFGHSDQGQGLKTMVEFVSANPTGPLHVGHGRQAALGDAIAELLSTQGYQVSREFYYNDAGAQIQNLALSVQARAKGLQPGDDEWPEQAYNGEYIQDIANDFLTGKTVQAKDGEPANASGDPEDLNSITQFAVTYLRNEQDLDLEAFGVRFDHFFLESSLYTNGKVEQTVADLIASGHTFEEDGALWLKTCDFGDDKNRVMRKSSGHYTYFVPDVAYHIGKWQRGFKKVINVQGTDHFGTIARVRAGLQILNPAIPQGYPEYVLHNMVKVMRDGQEVKLSKRAGSYVTVRDLIEWVGRDATRFFLLSRKPEAQFVFDIDLALKQNEENPVYYVQYAHARICSVFRQLQEYNLSYDQTAGQQHLDLLEQAHEEKIIKTLASYPEVLTKAALNEQPHQITYYLRDLANDFHSYYNAHKFIIDQADLRNARLTLIKATQQVLANALHLIGVSAPDKM